MGLGTPPICTHIEVAWATARWCPTLAAAREVYRSWYSPSPGNPKIMVSQSTGLPRRVWF